MTPILATKLYLPQLRSNIVSRSRLIERLNEGLHCKLTLLSAPAGFGKTTLLSEWLASCPRPAAWLSLDEGENDLVDFLSYLVAALQTVEATFGQEILSALSSPQPPGEMFLTVLLNKISTIKRPFVLVLDDYHIIEAEAVDQALAYLVEHLPRQVHLVIATREDPRLPLARLRVQGQLTEVRAADLQFTSSETSGFLNQVMGLKLSTDDIAALEGRTEGWIAGLQLAALSLRGHQDPLGFIRSFTGSHHFVMDYLMAEVFAQQPEHVQHFLLRTSILDRLCGSLCEAVVLDLSPCGQETLEYLERANLFLIPLDNERRWYRYHHLFADLLRQRLQVMTASSGDDKRDLIAELHRRASIWHEENGLEMEAFHHAAAAHNIDRAARLIESKATSVHFHGIVTPVLKWLGSLSTVDLNARPSLWILYASAMLFVGQVPLVEQKLQAAEVALSGCAIDDKTRDLVGQIASMRATLAVIQHDVEAIIAQSRRALEYLHPGNLPVRTAATWTLGYAYQLQGERIAASRAYAEVISIGESFGTSVYTLAATLSLGQVQETNNQLPLAAQTYRRVLQLAGDPPQPMACEAHLGLTRILYQWNDLAEAWRHGQQCLQLTQPTESIDTTALCTVFLARLKLARGDVVGAAAILDEAEELVHQHNFVHRMADVAAARILILLRQGKLSAAAHLAQAHNLPLGQARVYLAQGEASVALAVLESRRQQVEAKGWEDEQLQVMLLQAVALRASGEKEQAAHLIANALAKAEPGGFVRLFVDEGPPMADLLLEAKALGMASGYVEKLLAVLNADAQKHEDLSSQPPVQPLLEPLSRRELEVLQLLAQGLSNQEMSERLCLALDTVKGHNRKIFGKLQAQRRTEAIAHARELGLL